MKLQICPHKGTSTIEREYCILKQLCLASTLGASMVSIPCILWFGQESQFNAMVLDLLGSSLYDLITIQGKFNPLTVHYIGNQLMNSRP